MIDKASKNSIIKLVSEHNIRWIKKNFCIEEHSDELSVSSLISEITKYNNSKGEECNNELPPSLNSYYDKYYSNNSEAISRINNAILNYFVENKKILLISEEDESNTSRINTIKQSLGTIKGVKIFSRTFDYFENESDNAEIKSKDIDFVLCCLSKITNYQNIIAKLMYLIGCFGKDEICIIYDNEYMNSDFLSFLNNWAIVNDTYSGLNIMKSKFEGEKIEVE
ncbi:MAG: hypothetical protein LBM93_06905 [Oscillospiraceae bacterium]|jgi:hypothetical protein|nr:hypothetical protein [Oscillospiraceae bacterium]